MKNKSTLLLIEIGIMLFVFVLGAALCLYIFSYSDRLSKNTLDRDMATLQAQNIAEVLKSTDGDYAQAAKLLSVPYNDGVFTIHYDEDWHISAQPSVFCLTVYGLCSDTEQMCQGKIVVTENGKDDILITLTASWQRGGKNE